MGILSNAIVIVVNGGRMPVWVPAYEVSGLTGPLSSVLHYWMQGGAVDFLLHLGPLGDIIPLPIPPLQNVASVGDLFLTAGLAFFLFATLLRAPDEIEAAIVEARLGRYAGIPLPPQPVRLDENGMAIPQGTGLSPALEATAVLERPQMMGAGGIGLASPSATPYATESGAIGVAVPRARRVPVLERVRRHPYVRLGLNGSFSALWSRRRGRRRRGRSRRRRVRGRRGRGRGAGRRSNHAGCRRCRRGRHRVEARPWACEGGSGRPVRLGAGGPRGRPHLRRGS